jgi:hypothetical protein
MEGNGHHEAVGTIEAAVQSSERDATPLPDVAVVIEHGEPAQPPSIDSIIAAVVGTVLGAIGLAVRLFDLAIRQVVAPDAKAEQSETPLHAAVASALELVAGSVRVGLVVADRAVMLSRPVASLVMNRTPARRPVERAARMADAWSRRAADEQERREELATSVLEALVPGIAQVIVDRLDVDALIEGVDIDRILGRVDIDALVSRIDLDQIVGKLDIDGLASRIDIDAIAGRIDIDAIMRRVDIQAIVNKLDLPALTREVIDEVDVGEIIRESTGSITTETVDAIRYQGMNADRFVSRVVDRVLMRRSGRDTGHTVPIDPAPAAETTAGSRTQPGAGAEPDIGEP